MVGFSPRKARFSIYLATGDTEREELLEKLGKHKAGKGCIYVNKLQDINTDILKQLINQSIDFLKKRYEYILLERSYKNMVIDKDSVRAL